MTSQDRVTFVSPYPIATGSVKGGAQTVAAQLYEQFVSLGWNVHVLMSAAWLENVAPQAKFTDTLLGAELTVVSDPSARLAQNILPSDAEYLVGGSSLVVVMDRWVGQIVADGCVVLLLSNIAYTNERIAAEQLGWDSVWVPSAYLAAQVLALPGSGATEVCVVQPVIAPHTCESNCPIVVGHPIVVSKNPGRRRLLFPHRLDVGKGLLDAVGLLALLAGRNPGWTLMVTAGSGHDEPGKEELLSETFRMVTQFSLSENFKLISWLPQTQMACLYVSNDVTLIGSMLPEGFGLVLFESLAAGVPVVTTSVGNLGQAFAGVDGVWTVDRLASEAGVEAVYEAYASGVDSHTKHAVQQRYSWSAQREALKRALVMLRSAAG